MKNDLFKYLKYLEYKTFRYKFLLDTIQRDFCEMTDDEWNDSLEQIEKIPRVLVDRSSFNVNLSQEEINILALLMLILVFVLPDKRVQKHEHLLMLNIQLLLLFALKSLLLLKHFFHFQELDQLKL